MKNRPEFIRRSSEMPRKSVFTYPGDTETFGAYAPVSRELGLKRVAVSYEVLAPGKRSAWPHAHSVEEELVFILEGNPQAWINGEVHDLGPEDVIAFPPGTGIAHCIINNTERDVKMIVVGECDPKGDQIFYPLHPKRNEEVRERGRLWETPPRFELGTHDGRPDRK